MSRPNPRCVEEDEPTTRRVFCAHVSECLQLAAVEHWPGMDCSRCRVTTEDRPTLEDIAGRRTSRPAVSHALVTR